MRTRERETPPLPEPVVSWRSRRLRTGGFPAQLADALSRDRAWDLHALLELVDRGCPPDLAARIVSPVGEKSSS